MRMLRRTRKRTRRTTRSEKALSCAVRGCFSCRPRLCQLEDAPRVLQLLSTFSPPWHSSGGGRPCVAGVRDVMSGLGRGIRGPRQIENSSNCRSSSSEKCRQIAQHCVAYTCPPIHALSEFHRDNQQRQWRSLRSVGTGACHILCCLLICIGCVLICASCGCVWISDRRSF